LAAVAVITAVTGLACSDILGSASRSPIASISALSLPYPTVVIGDVMRDSLGEAAPVSIQAFDASGKLVTDQSPQFTILDATTNTLASTVQIDQSGIVHGIARDTVGARVFAAFGTLTAPAQRVLVSVAPTRAAKTIAAWDINFVDTIPDTLRSSNWSLPLELTLTDASGSIGAQGFVITYAVTRFPAPLNPGDQAAYIGDDTGKPSARDTTDFKGLASRRVVLRQSKLDTASVRKGLKTDTIIVRATVKYNGVDVAGTPLDYIIPVTKKP
jgi:hypothetical protein